MYQSRDLERICKNVALSIEDELTRVGVFFRIFHRVKQTHSTEIKILERGINYYNGQTKFLRDIIGIRVILYFSDDLPIVNNQLKNRFGLVEETVDKNEETRFAPTRENLIFKLPEVYIKEFNDLVSNNIFDSTFEVQLRTILSEGWHEIDHDLRYKCKNDWKDNSDLARNFNGILASLETSEYSILRLFEQMSYRHYKTKDISAMLRTKFRLRFSSDKLSLNLEEKLTDDFIKDIFKLDRNEILNYIFNSKILIPLNIENLIYVLNFKFINNQEIKEITPIEIIRDLS